MVTGGPRDEGANYLISTYLKRLGTPQKVIDLRRKADPNSLKLRASESLGLARPRQARKKPSIC
jgi:hypothetical protein